MTTPRDMLQIGACHRGERRDACGSDRRSRFPVEPTLGSPKTRRDCSLLGKTSSAAEFENLRWLDDRKHPLDWNGPTGRIFIKFGDDDLDRSIIDHFERVARRHPDRIAITDSDTSVSFAQLWDGLSGLAETISRRKQTGRVGRHSPAAGPDVSTRHVGLPGCGTPLLGPRSPLSKRLGAPRYCRMLGQL